MALPKSKARSIANWLRSSEEGRIEKLRAIGTQQSHKCVDASDRFKTANTETETILLKSIIRDRKITIVLSLTSAPVTDILPSLATAIPLICVPQSVPTHSPRLIGVTKKC